MLRLIAGESVELDLALSPELNPVMADPSQMEQVIMNLALNARDAIPAAGRIRIETANCEIPEAMARESRMPAGACVTLSISDNGHGMAPETLDRIFEPFFTTKESGRGTGLGLSTVQRIVNEAGGQIRVHSAAGEGSTFTICLPQCARAAERSERPAYAALNGGGSETLLLVEDEEGVRRLLTHVLDRRGYRVLAAADAEEALRIFTQHSAEIGLVLTDMVMPQMSGRELGAVLEEMRPGIKIIYMSGYTDDVLVRTGALSPGMSFLQKPLRPDVLAAKVREALDAEGSGRSVAAS
jgi:CheY-like chemotaxis protein